VIRPHDPPSDDCWLSKCLYCPSIANLSQAIDGQEGFRSQEADDRSRVRMRGDHSATPLDHDADRAWSRHSACCPVCVQVNDARSQRRASGSAPAKDNKKLKPATAVKVRLSTCPVLWLLATYVNYCCAEALCRSHQNSVHIDAGTSSARNRARRVWPGPIISSHAVPQTSCSAPVCPAEKHPARRS